MHTANYPATLDQLEPMLLWILEEAKTLGFAEQKLYQIRLVAEEVLVNIINYGYPDKNGDIQINLIPKEKESLTIEVVDSGISFDPLSRPDPDLSLPLEDRKIGGLGVFLLRKLMDEVSYKRQDNRNILTFVKKL